MKFYIPNEVKQFVKKLYPDALKVIIDRSFLYEVSNKKYWYEVITPNGNLMGMVRETPEGLVNKITSDGRGEFNNGATK